MIDFYFLHLVSSQSLHSRQSCIVAMSPKAKKPPLVLSKFANKQKVPKTPPVIRSLFGAAMPKAKATTPMKRKTGKSEGSPAGPSDSPPAKQRSPASDAEDHQGSSSSGAAASSSSGHFVATGNDLVLAVYEVDDSTKCTMCEKNNRQQRLCRREPQRRKGVQEVWRLQQVAKPSATDLAETWRLEGSLGCDVS